MGKRRNGCRNQIMLNRKQNVRPDVAEGYSVHMHVPKLWSEVKDIVYRKHLNPSQRIFPWARLHQSPTVMSIDR